MIFFKEPEIRKKLEGGKEGYQNTWESIVSVVYYSGVAFVSYYHE